MTGVADRLPALAGLIDFRNRTDLKERCGALLPSANRKIAIAGPAAFGTAAGAQPWCADNAGVHMVSRPEVVIVGDVRLDNRLALASELGTASGQSDCEIVLAACSRWGGAAAVDRLRGDYVFALWSEARDELELVRGPLSAGQLFYRSGPGWLAFASRAQLLADVHGTEKSLDFDSAARFVAGIPQPGPSTFFTGVRRLEQACSLRFDGNQLRVNRFWSPVRSVAQGRTDKDLAEEFRDLFDTAVRERTARRSGLVAAHLSAGRDSGAVVGSAASMLSGRDERMLAFTSAPRHGFEGSGFEDCLDDETIVARATAALQANVQHIVVRPGAHPFAGVSEAHSITPNPLAHVSNFAWGGAILDGAAAAGATVLLSGDVGNFSVSAGGRSYLSSVLREKGLIRWLRQARSQIRSPADVLRVLNCTFGGRMPLWAHRRLRRLTGFQISEPLGLRLLREPFRSSVAALVASELGDFRPPADPFVFRAEMLAAQDPSNSVGRAMWGIDGRDPTADRNLVDFCFSIPAHLLLGGHNARPLYEMAFEDRLDPRQLRPRTRGYQGADWYLSFTRQAVAERLGECRQHACVGELIDLDYADEMLASWPACWALDRMYHYRNDLLGAVAVADYIRTNF